MAYKQQYNTRFSGRYNTPGQFVAASELADGRASLGRFTPRLTAPSFPQQGQTNKIQQNFAPVQQQEEEMDESDNMNIQTEEGTPRPHWMKTKLPGVKKVSNRERRRRQNENLRRLLTPKNALMVLNEMMPNEQVANQFKVEPATNSQYNTYKNIPTFRADLTLEGNTYEGYGDNKLMARNAAAEQAIRDLIIKKMNKAINSDSGSLNGTEGPDEEALPMIQLASFALHKLFSVWEYEGHKVPQLKPSGAGAADRADAQGNVEELSLNNVKKEAEVKKVKELPTNASAMHPCMLLTYMRPHLEYRELSAQGDRPQNMLFTMAVDVDGCTYMGKATNKKEARKAAAKAACQELFGVKFDTIPSVNTPQTSNM